MKKVVLVILRSPQLKILKIMYEGRSHEMSSLDEKYYQYEGQHYEPYATIIGQSGLPLSIPYGLFQYAKHKDDPRNAKVKDSLRRGKWTVRNLRFTTLKRFILAASL